MSSGLVGSCRESDLRMKGRSVIFDWLCAESEGRRAISRVRS